MVGDLELEWWLVVGSTDREGKLSLSYSSRFSFREGPVTACVWCVCVCIVNYSTERSCLCGIGERGSMMLRGILLHNKKLIFAFLTRGNGW